MADSEGVTDAVNRKEENEMRQLHNGATVIDESETHCLTQRQGGRSGVEFVTWAFEYGTRDDVHSGNYFESIERAVADFQKRTEGAKRLVLV